MGQLVAPFHLIRLGRVTVAVVVRLSILLLTVAEVTLANRMLPDFVVIDMLHVRVYILRLLLSRNLHLVVVV